MGFKFLLKNKINSLPKNPGVYTFKNSRKILYIGKAANIKERVKNHFQQPGYRDYLFLDKINKIGYLKTDSEIEALILEANLIKKYQPKYNVVWRDDKNYFFVGITKEDFPKVFITHQPIRQALGKPKLKIGNCKLKINYIGPFVDGNALKQTLKVSRKVFPYRSCKTLLKRPCLWYQLGRCPGPCSLKPDKSSLLRSNILFAKIRGGMKKISQENTKNLMKVLQGKKTQVLKNLRKEIKKLSLSQNFERAAKIRDQIIALKKVISHARIFSQGENQYSIKMPWHNYQVWRKTEKKLRKFLGIEEKISRIEAYDVSNIQGQAATGSMVTFINSQPDKNFYRRFKVRITGKPNDIAMIKECLMRRIKHLEWPLPDLILIDGGKAQLNAALQCLRSGLKHIAVIALAKKKNGLYLKNKGKPILLKNLPREIFNLILQLRDEAHRFARAYHHKLREVDILG